MRDLNDDEMHALNKLRICPNCGSEYFNGGPRGGLCQNFECVSCGAKYNLPLVNLLFGQLIFEPANYQQKFGFRDSELIRVLRGFKERLVAAFSVKRWGSFRRET